MIAALLRTWGRTQVRAHGFAMVMGTTAVFVVMASSWAARRLVGRADAGDVLAYAELYVGIAFTILSVFSLQDVVRLLLSERSDIQLFHLAPVPRRTLVTARVLFNMLNCMLLSTLITLPSLGILGAFVDAPWPYYALLAPTLLVVVIGACGFGGACALPLAWFLRFWAGRRARQRPPELQLALELGSTVIRPHVLLAATVLLPLLDATLGRVHNLFPSFWALPLAMAARGAPIWRSLVPPLGTALGLAAVAFLAHTAGERLSLEKRFPRRRRAARPSPVRFGRLSPLVRAPLRAYWLFDIGLIIAAVGLLGFFSLHFEPAFLSLFLAAGLAMGTGGDADGQVFTRPFLFKLAPSPTIKVTALLSAGNVLKAAVGVGLGTLGFASVLAARGDPVWAIPVLVYPLHVLTLIAPLIAATTGLRIWKALGSLYVTDIQMAGTGLALAATLAASRYLLFPDLSAPFAHPWRMAGVAVGLSLFYAAGLYLLFRLAARSLDRLEWT